MIDQLGMCRCTEKKSVLVVAIIEVTNLSRGKKKGGVGWGEGSTNITKITDHRKQTQNTHVYDYFITREREA